MFGSLFRPFVLFVRLSFVRSFARSLVSLVRSVVCRSSWPVSVAGWLAGARSFVCFVSFFVSCVRLFVWLLSFVRSFAPSFRSLLSFWLVMLRLPRTDDLETVGLNSPLSKRLCVCQNMSGWFQPILIIVALRFGFVEWQRPSTLCQDLQLG